jgi:Domain of unknown function (DUF4158)
LLLLNERHPLSANGNNRTSGARRMVEFLRAAAKSRGHRQQSTPTEKHKITRPFRSRPALVLHARYRLGIFRSRGSPPTISVPRPHCSAIQRFPCGGGKASRLFRVHAFPSCARPAEPRWRRRAQHKNRTPVVRTVRKDRPSRRRLLPPDRWPVLLNLPADEESLIRRYTMSGDDLDRTLRKRGHHNQLGFAVQLRLMRHTGCLLVQNDAAPAEVVNMG